MSEFNVPALPTSPFNTKSKLCFSDCTQSEPRSFDRGSLFRLRAFVELLVFLVLLQLLQEVPAVSESEGFELCERRLQVGLPQVCCAPEIRVDQPRQGQELQLTKEGDKLEDRGQLTGF